jgi:hypothetical protein
VTRWPAGNSRPRDHTPVARRRGPYGGTAAAQRCGAPIPHPGSDQRSSCSSRAATPAQRVRSIRNFDLSRSTTGRAKGIANFVLPIFISEWGFGGVLSMRLRVVLPRWASCGRSADRWRRDDFRRGFDCRGATPLADDATGISPFGGCGAPLMPIRVQLIALGIPIKIAPAGQQWQMISFGSGKYLGMLMQIPIRIDAGQMPQGTHRSNPRPQKAVPRPRIDLAPAGPQPRGGSEKSIRTGRPRCPQDAVRTPGIRVSPAAVGQRW